MLASILEAVPLEAPLPIGCLPCSQSLLPSSSACLLCLDVHAQIDMKVLQIGEQLGGSWTLLWLTVPAAVHYSKAREGQERLETDLG